MKPSNSQLLKDLEACELFPSMCLPGPQQMALDRLLLENSLKDKAQYPKLRFYTWDGVWLSIGRNQNKIPEKWKDLAKAGELQIVRRPSGGGAVLHLGGITYSIIWPNAPHKRREAYEITCDWLINCFEQLGLPLMFGNDDALHGERNCFASSTVADLIDKKGNKRIGSAQLWHHGHLLQHGEILLDPPKTIWKKVFGDRPPEKAPEKVPREGLEELLQKAWYSISPKMIFHKKNFSNEDIKRVNKNAQTYKINLD